MNRTRSRASVMYATVIQIVVGVSSITDSLTLSVYRLSEIGVNEKQLNHDIQFFWKSFSVSIGEVSFLYAPSLKCTETIHQVNTHNCQCQLKVGTLIFLPYKTNNKDGKKETLINGI